MRVIRAAGQTMPMVALYSVAWCCVFAAVHLFRAVGGSTGLASSAGTDLAARRPAAFVILGLWGVAGLLLLAAVGIVAVGTRQHDSRVVRVGAWTVARVGSGLLVRGIAVEVLLAADIGARAARASRQRIRERHTRSCRSR